MTTTRIGRNDLCHCGSGKTFKKCCLRSKSSQEFAPTGWRHPPGQPDAAPPEGGEWIDYFFVKGKGWTHKKELKPGDQYKIKEGGWETVQPERLIRATMEHPFWVKDKGWTEAGNLKPGDLVRTDNGWVPISKVEDTGQYEKVYNLRVADYHTYFVGDEGWSFAVWAYNAYKVGNMLTRTVGGRTETVNLPAIDMGHLLSVMVDGNKVRGFHILPASVIAVTSTSPITLPVGSILIVDRAGAPMTNATVRITPLRVPADGYDAFEAMVEVLDAAGIVVAFDAAKSFYPQAWTADQIQEAIYSAYSTHYRSGGSPVFLRAALTTPKGVVIEMRVNGSQSSSGTKLTGIPTAYLRQGQHFTVNNAP